MKKKDPSTFAPLKPGDWVLWRGGGRPIYKNVGHVTAFYWWEKGSRHLRSMAFERGVDFPKIATAAEVNTWLAQTETERLRYEEQRRQVEERKAGLARTVAFLTERGYVVHLEHNERDTPPYELRFHLDSEQLADLLLVLGKAFASKQNA